MKHFKIHWLQSRRRKVRTRSQPHSETKSHETVSVDGAVDGAACSITKKTPYSIREIAEVPVYWSSITRMYDPRIDPRIARLPRKSVATQTKSHTRRSTTCQTRGGSRASLSQGKHIVRNFNRCSASRRSSASFQSAVRSFLSSQSSQSSEQRGILDQFTAELALYVEAQRKNPKQSSITRPSITTPASVITIQELKPYRAQFEAAGLAITSAEQRGTMAKLSRAGTAYQSPEISRETIQLGGDGFWSRSGKSPKRREPSYASGSTGSPVVGFTPPHEKSYPRPNKPRRAPTESSGGSGLSFGLQHEKVATRTSPSKASALKKSLPWVSTDRIPPSSPSPKSNIKTDGYISKPGVDRLQGWVEPNVKITESSPDSKLHSMYFETTLTIPEASQPSHYCGTEIKWNNPKYDPVQKDVRPRVADPVIRLVPPPASIPKYYTDKSTQTEDTIRKGRGLSLKPLKLENALKLGSVSKPDNIPKPDKIPKPENIPRLENSPKPDLAPKPLDVSREGPPIDIPERKERSRSKSHPLPILPSRPAPQAPIAPIPQVVIEPPPKVLPQLPAPVVTAPKVVAEDSPRPLPPPSPPVPSVPKEVLEDRPRKKWSRGTLEKSPQQAEPERRAQPPVTCTQCNCSIDHRMNNADIEEYARQFPVPEPVKRAPIEITIIIKGLEDFDRVVGIDRAAMRGSLSNENGQGKEWVRSACAGCEEEAR